MKQFVLAWTEMKLVATQMGVSNNKHVSVFPADLAKDN